jgi:hypothetical protein
VRIQRRIRKAIQPPTNPFHKSLLTEVLEISPRDANRLDILWTNDAFFLDETDNLVGWVHLHLLHILYQCACL